MKFQNPCIACSKRQGSRIFQIALGGEVLDEERHEALRAELDERLGAVDPALSPADLSLIAIRAAQRHANCYDPFAAQKKSNNELALSMVDDLRQRLDESSDRLHLAGRLAACGNIIDLGVADQFDIHAAIDRVVLEGFRKDDFGEFIHDLDRLNKRDEPPRLLYCCDNAGEIVFDRLFIEELLSAYPRLEITAVVRAAPVLNDATREDARIAGLDQVVRVIDNGNDKLGTVIESAGDELREAYRHADIIISKGQANYETLACRPENIYFILKAKCDVIASSLGVGLYDAVMTREHRKSKVSTEKN
ncbi:MAG: DUF89 family protein [bacterium]|nr:DUF89 family protein [bacterium]